MKMCKKAAYTMPGMFVTDFDGTLLTDEKQIHQQDLDTLAGLRTAGIVTVIATGRSLFSFKRALTQMGLEQKDLPVDYLIFSTGAGIQCLKTDSLIRSYAISIEGIRKIIAYFDSLGFDYMVHKAVPDTPHFLFRSNSQTNPDFEHRIRLYPDFGSPLNGNDDLFKQATEVLAIVPGGLPRSQVNAIQSDLSEFSVIHATSPLDHQSSWIEVFHPKVSKSSSADWLVRHLDLSQASVTAVGNDYNDEDLLEWSGNAFLVENGPKDLKGRFKAVASNNACGVTQAVRDSGLLTGA